MTTSDAPLRLDEELAREVERRAAERGEEPGEFVNEVLRRHFVLEVFDRIWSARQDELSEDEALNLAYEELDAMRSERDASGA